MPHICGSLSKTKIWKDAISIACNTKKKFCVLQKKILSFGPNCTVEVRPNSSAEPNVRSVTTLLSNTQFIRKTEKKCNFELFFWFPYYLIRPCFRDIKYGQKKIEHNQNIFEHFLNRHLCYWEENICKRIEISYLLMFFLSITLHKLPCGGGKFFPWKQIWELASIWANFSFKCSFSLINFKA